MSTVTCLFASGYKFNLSWPLQYNRLLQKTGTLNIETSPKGAFIYLNEKKTAYPGIKIFKKDYLTTPSKVKNLLPGKYNLKLEKEGYWPIQKEIFIESGITTTIENIHLFRSDLPTIVYRSTSTSLSLSPSSKYIYLESSGQLVDLTNSSFRLELDNNSNGSWQDNENFFADGLIYNINNENIINLNNEVKIKADSWKYDRDNSSIYYTANKSIFRFEKDNTASLIISNIENYLDYKQDGNLLFLILEIDDDKFLKEYDINTQQEIKSMELPKVGNYLFFPGAKNGHLTLYDEQNSSLYLINKNDWQKSSIINQVRDWVFINKTQMIYHNGWEIFLLDLKEDSSRLLTRVSEPISKIIWHDRENYYIFSTVNTLQAGDLRSNLLTTLFKTEKIGDIALDSKQDLLYFYSEIGQQSGVYKFLLK